jgi:heme exporter protein A
MALLEAIAIECTRGDRPLVSGLSFSVQSGELLHVAGSNGSGKTTLLRTLCGLSKPNAGEIHWDGTPIQELDDEYRCHLAYVGHSDAVQGELTPLENLRTAGCLAGGGEVSDARPALERVGLSSLSRLPAKLLSQGQKRRLALARLLLAPKRLWILDEPFSGLDARSVAVIEDLLGEHLDVHGMVVITSHQEHAWRARTVRRISLDA